MRIVIPDLNVPVISGLCSSHEVVLALFLFHNILILELLAIDFMPELVSIS